MPKAVAKKAQSKGPVKKEGGQKEKKAHKPKPAPIAGPVKAVAQREAEDWVAIGLQSSSQDKKSVQEKALKTWLASNYAGAQGEGGSKFLKQQLPKILVKLLGDGLVVQQRGKWKLSQKGLVKFGDITKKK
jgi:hypothetical protein